MDRKVENKKTSSSDGSSSSRIINTSGFITCFIVTLILITGLSGVVSVSAAAPSITNWSSTGGTTTNKDNPQDLMYLVQPGDEITFSVTANEACNYNWSVNKVDQGINSNAFTFTVPSLNCSQDLSKCIWEIHAKVYNDNGEAHHEWVISTLSEEEALISLILLQIKDIGIEQIRIPGEDHYQNGVKLDVMITSLILLWVYTTPLKVI